MSEQVEQTPPEEAPKQYDPGPKFKEQVKEVLEELGLLGGPETPVEPPKSKVRTLRQEEADSEFLVNKVLDKLAAKEPPVKKEPEAKEPEAPPGPPPKKRRIQSVMWGS